MTGAISKAAEHLSIFEIARVLVHSIHVARFTVNANHWTVSFIAG
jgi:hypothetical protein